MKKTRPRTVLCLARLGPGLGCRIPLSKELPSYGYDDDEKKNVLGLLAPVEGAAAAFPGKSERRASASSWRTGGTPSKSYIFEAL